ncbi:dipeptidase [Planctomycetota bacterium]
MGLTEALAYLESTAGEREAELMELLRIPSVSTDSSRRGDVRRAAMWVQGAMARAGLAASVEDTDGHPVVYGERLDGPPGAPTVLVYGHYDVQPADERKDGWTHPPFDPIVRDQNVYARGATDDKGQMFTWIKAAEAWHHVGGPPVNLKFLIEGEEEIGSRNLGRWIDGNKERLEADVVLVSDSDQYGPGMPALTYGLRGLLYVEIRCYGPNEDLHSGQYGGAVMNPATALARILGRLHDDEGRVLVDGFYDHVRPLESWEREAFAALPHDERAYADGISVSETFGEVGYSTLERTWARPTLEVNGIFGGFAGAGAKTVLPCYAGAKVSARLVPDQDPLKVLEGLRTTVERLAPRGVRVTVTGPGPGATAVGDERFNPRAGEAETARAVIVDRDNPFVRAAGAALERGFGRAPVYIRSGGSIPIVLAFKEVLGLDTVLMGYGLPDDRAHGPNEKFHLPDFHRGCRASATFIAEAAGGS